MLTELIESQSLKDKQAQMGNLSLLLNTHALPTKGNTWGFSSLILLTMGIYSNLAFVFLSDKSFVKPTLKWAFIFGPFTLAGVYVYSLITSKTLTEHRKLFRGKLENVRVRIQKAGTALTSKCSQLFTKKKDAGRTADE